jgi:hypothetical protein
MGCWNGTCMISNLPIRHREKVKLVFLYSPYSEATLNNSGGFCYSNGLLRPAFFPISGEYDDYGTIENIQKDWVYDLIISILKNKYTSIEVEKKEIKDYTLENVIRGIERGSLQVEEKNDTFKPSPFSFVMIRKDIWDGIVEKQWNSKDYWNDMKISKNDYYIDAPTLIQRKVDAYIKETKVLEKIFKNKEEFYTNSEMFDFESRLFEHYLHNDFFSKNINNPDLIKDYTELTIIKTFLDITRKAWMIQCGAGSQNSDIQPYLVLSELIQNVAKDFDNFYD